MCIFLPRGTPGGPGGARGAPGGEHQAPKYPETFWIFRKIDFFMIFVGFRSFFVHVCSFFVIFRSFWSFVGPGNIFFDKQKGCGGESLRRLFRLDFCIFEFFIKSIFEEMTKIAQNHIF